MNYSRYFPNVEELRFYGQGQDTADLENFLQFKSFRIDFPLLHVQKLYFHFSPRFSLNYKDVTASRLLELVPNVKEIHGVPITMVQEFRDIGKLHVLRSVVYCKHNRVMTETEGMRMLVQAKLKFRFLFIGKKFHWYLDNSFIQTSKESFEDLLELGKETIEHFIVQPLKPKSLIAFPNEMPAVKHIGLWGICGGFMYFEHGEDLSKRFPNVNTILFYNFTERMWTQSKRWWLPGGMFHSNNFRGQITCLKSNVNLKRSIEDNLLDKFISVKEVNIETNDPDGDDYIAGGII
ncbi:unnamed protein product [Allacma fusca]|uniref:Uncharacterized protein n=1 Tax=Allacma fusca TaxID=39272 RepID=A0A8J2KFC6_9HEXA|nr:unnamed protein product [Allacma fusca]